ncbi:sulfotransferase [Algivirga pacifica]|uniref:Sulfotransferase domain-containing protein n=1 Tax=Algivirga pacifica TaxID=1162670 RepID=A0ABP9D7D9_9BACT
MTNKPNLFIVGAPKSGSTFLFQTLGEHSDIFFPVIKELNFFSKDSLEKDSYYKDYKTQDLNSYLKGFSKNTGEKYLVDSSVSYFTFDDVPQKIRDFNQDAKIIIITRDPYKRAYSHYLMDKRMGYASGDFSDYLTSEDSFHYNQYVTNSLYYQNSKRYVELFGRKNVLFLRLENLREDMSSLFEFLDIPAIDIDFDKKVNENKAARNIFGRYAQHNRELVQKMKLYLPSQFFELAKLFVYKKEAKSDRISTEDLNLLESLIHDDYEIFKKEFFS